MFFRDTFTARREPRNSEREAFCPARKAIYPVRKPLRFALAVIYLARKAFSRNGERCLGRFQPVSLVCRRFDNLDFGFGQAVEVIDQAVNLCVRGGDLAFQRGLFLRRPRGGQLPVQLQHLLHQLHHPVVRGFVEIVPS